jgi:hypothetical protein
MLTSVRVERESEEGGKKGFERFESRGIGERVGMLFSY